MTPDALPTPTDVRSDGGAASTTDRAGATRAITADDPGYRAARSGCVAIDRSDVGKLAISGLDAIGFLQAHLTVDVLTLEVGSGRTGALLTPKGALLGTLRVLRGQGAIHLDCERAALEGIFRSFHRGSVGWEVELGKRTLQLAQVCLIGPAARAAVGIAADAPEHEHRVVRVGRTWALAIATPRGVDLRCAIDRRPGLLAGLEAAGAVVGDEALWELLRVEAGLPRYGAELNERTLPAEAGLVPDVVALDKPLYPGMQTVLRQERSGTVHRSLRGLRLSAPVAADAAVTSEDDASVGRVGTAVVSPRLGPVALAVVRRSAEPGTRVRVGEHAVVGEVVALPW